MVEALGIEWGVNFGIVIKVNENVTSALPAPDSLGPSHLLEGEGEFGAGQETVFCAETLKQPQTFLLLLAETESQVIAVIAGAEIGIEFFLLGDHVFNPAHICIARRAQLPGDFFRAGDFRPDQPKGVDKGTVPQILPGGAQVPKLEVGLALPEGDGLIANEKARRIRLVRAGDELRGEAALREQTTQKVNRGLGGGIDHDLAQLREGRAMGNHHAVNRAVGSNRDVVHDRVNGVAQIFEARDEGDIELPGGQLPAERGGMIEMNRTGPAVNQRSRVEILDAAEAKRTAHLKRRPVRLLPARRWRTRTIGRA